MKVSIVTPSYNQAAYLPDCLQSVSGQAYAALEHIVVDGGSTDGSLEILNDFHCLDGRMRFTSEPDGGQGDAVNKGFASLTGDLVAWINSDDFFFSPGVFHHVVDLFSRHPEVDVVYGGVAWVDSSARLLHVRIPPAFDWRLLTRIAYMVNTGVFFRRRVIEAHQVDASLHYVIDHEFLLRVTRDFRPLRTRQIIGCFRVQPLAKTQTMCEDDKNAERRVRDSRLGLRASKGAWLVQGLDRLRYRCDLLLTDAIYLPRWREQPPYQPFLGGSQLRRYGA